MVMRRAASVSGVESRSRGGVAARQRRTGDPRAEDPLARGRTEVADLDEVWPVEVVGEDLGLDRREPGGGDEIAHGVGDPVERVPGAESTRVRAPGNHGRQAESTNSSRAASGESHSSSSCTRISFNRVSPTLSRV